MHQNRWLFCFLRVLTLMMIHQTTSALFYVDSICSNSSIFGNISAYRTNLNTLFLSLSTNATNPSGFYRTTVGNPPNETIYGHYLCRGDQNSGSCHECVTSATTTDLPKTNCPNRKVAIIWYDECMVRYSNVSFFNQMDEEPVLIMWNTFNQTGNSTQATETLMNMTSNYLACHAARGGSLKKFATGIENISVSQSMYGLAQCTPDLSPSDCYQCLYSSIKQFRSQSRGGRVFGPSCVVRYEAYPFFDLSQPPSSQGSNNPGAGGRTKVTKLFPSTFISIFIPISIVIAILLYFGIRRFKHKRKATQTLNNEGMDDIVAVESLRFDLNTIRSATSNFSGDTKLGQGGFGEVYKGTLENGQEIAVKRLSRNSKQGVAEFKTEVILVAKLQHKNLVKLLGFCVTSMENILIYEFLSNSSLDRFLSEGGKKSSLDWETRFKIIHGTARGLLYLHEDSRLKVIHRDLKPSNILLDEGMNPKISDFGLAKLFEMDETQGATNRIVGTYGYMAPEYAITGHYSVKSDVYSFGVILLEVVSGQMNRSFQPQLEEALLYRAWRLWSEDKALELVDAALRSNFSREQVMQCIHIGLLCIQEDAYERPSMGPIVAALNGQSVSFSTPKAPYFLRSGGVGEEHSKPNIYTGGEQMTDLYSRD